MNTQTYISDDLVAIQSKLKESPWLITCLCAAWCGTCKSYREAFDLLQNAHPEKCFAWIDIEDHADLVDALDIENFPTILIQYESKLLFLGTMLPDANLVNRLISSLDDSLQRLGLDQTPSTIQNSDYPLPANWSLRELIERIN